MNMSEQITQSPHPSIGLLPKKEAFCPEFVRVEKNLISLGFFTPSNKTIQGIKQKKISIMRQSDGSRIEGRAVILTSAVYGLPVTGDQDKYFALQKIITDLRRQKGEIRNPVGFSSAELLRVLGLRVTA